MSLLGALDPQSLVILAVAVVGVVPVVMYYERTSKWFVYAYGFLFVAAFCTNFEYVVLPDLLNYTEHVVGNMGAGLAFAAAAYLYRRRTILPDDDATTRVEAER